MTSTLATLAAGLLAGAGGVCLWLAVRPRLRALPAFARARIASALAPGIPRPGPAVAPDATEPTQNLSGSQQGWLRVADAKALLAAVHAADTLAHLRRQSRLSPAVFDRDFGVAIERYAEFVQLMPASESHHHAHAGGLLAHTLEMVLAALTWRNGHLLPQGAQAELVDVQRDQWTYVVFFATLLHDVGKPMTDLRVLWRKSRSAADLRWMPLSGSLVDCAAAEYRVGFAPKSERDYMAHQRLGVTVLQRIAPASALTFLATVPEAMTALTRTLNGEDRDGAIAKIVKRADQASVGHALMHGSRARFTTTSSVPLVELLMSAVRDLLRKGGAMPLNRDGAIGWVHDGSVWFVAKRLADTVRDHLQQHSPDDAVPGETKNDRLFDTWQEYGCLVPNPGTGQAIWHVRVHGEDGAGYSHKLSMLRFPMDKLWDDPHHFPQDMRGRIEVMAGREDPSSSGPAGSPGEVAAGAPEPGTAAASSSSSSAPSAPAGDAAAPGAITAPLVGTPNAEARRSKTANAAPLVPAPRFEGSGKKGKAAAAAVKPAVPSAAPASTSAAAAASPAAHAESNVSRPVPRGEDEDYLDDDDSAVAESRKGAEPLTSPTGPGAGSALPQPVALPNALPRLPGDSTFLEAKAPPELAVAFMRWLQQGLATRDIRYNETGTPVHFVSQGMALVSPLIFREFARQTGAAGYEGDPGRAGLDVQRDVLKAGWHLPAAGGVNIHQFSVLKRGGVRAGKLAAVVLIDPQRWVVPVPPANPALTPFVEERAAQTE